MKIAYIAGYSGVPSNLANSVHIMKMCNAYVSLGADLTLYISGNSENSDASIFRHYQINNPFKLKIHTFPLGKIYKLWFLAFKLPFQAKLHKANLIHTRNLASAWGAACLFGEDTILELHDIPVSNSKSFKMLAHLVSSKRLKFIICITHALAAEVKKIVGNQVKIYVLADGVSKRNLESFGKKEFLRSSLGRENKFTCVYTGNLYKGKGVELIVEISKLMPEVEFLVVGGNEKDVLEFSSKYQFSDNFKLIGFQTQEVVVKYQQLADVLLLPNQAVSMSVGLKGRNIAAFTSPLKMFEYMAAGNPILSSSLPVLQEILTDNHNALILPFNDVQEWVDAIEKLRQNQELGARLGGQAKLEARNYTWEKRAEEILKLYASC
jgi:glycosyltransferase involved in cell wall biosynthesis